tara:strand:- start:148 stop:450 length:303 start_codon:yes stop_codon:yes gene_type:complete
MTNLETIIQKALVANTDPFTTEADIRFFETETFEKERNVFMNNLWGSDGKTITTPLGVGVIEEVRTQAGIDFQVRVKIPNIDGFTLFSGLKLFEEKSVIS